MTPMKTQARNAGIHSQKGKWQKTPTKAMVASGIICMNIATQSRIPTDWSFFICVITTRGPVSNVAHWVDSCIDRPSTVSWAVQPEWTGTP